MAKNKKANELFVPISKQRARLDLHELLEDALLAAGAGDWDQVHKYVSRAAPLARGIVTAPLRLRKLKELPANDTRFSSSLQTGLRILALFGEDGARELGIADIADALGMSRSTTHRYAISLLGLGQLTQNKNRKYKLAEA